MAAIAAGAIIGCKGDDRGKVPAPPPPPTTTPATPGQPGDIGEFERGESHEARYGAHIDGDGGVHFAVYAPDARQVNLLLFGVASSTAPSHVVPMRKHRGDWRVQLKGPGIGPGLHYMFQAAGPAVPGGPPGESDPAEPPGSGPPSVITEPGQHGHSFNEHYYLGDPYAYKTQNVRYSRVFRKIPHADITAPIYAGGGKSVVHRHDDDRVEPGHVALAPHDLIIYELHVQDYTARITGLDPKLRGTYLGLARSGLTTPGGLSAGIDHLVDLGVTAVELMPVMEYDEETGNIAGRHNHWGYMTTNFFAPEARYAAVEGDQVVELKTLVKAFHDRGIAVLMDAVYNHTAEQSPWRDAETGTIARKCYNLMCLVGARVYRGTESGHFRNNTGTGNDLDFTGPDNRFTKRLVTDSLAMWHQSYGIDGFRFDLARILADGSHSSADWVDNDPRYDKAHLHAEPWDIGGVWWAFMDSHDWGHHNNRWAKWLGRYRDHVRNFSKSSLRDTGAFKRLIEGRGDAGDDARDGDGKHASSKPWRSINFISVHDGYTLRDCTYYNDDGGSHNCWDSDGDEDLRRTRSKLLLGILFTSHGAPLLLQGDEFGRTKSGAQTQDEAHNTYNYESVDRKNTAIDHVSWIDWQLKDGNPSSPPGAPRYGRELVEWTRALIGLRKKWSHFRRADFVEYIAGQPRGARNDGKYTYSWEGPGPESTTQLGVIWWGEAGEPDLLVVYNEHWQPVRLDNLQVWSGGDWRILARSWLDDESDVCALESWNTSCPKAGPGIEVAGRAMAILISDND